MNSMKTCKVKLLNKYFEIKCPEGEEVNLLLAARQLDEKIRQNKAKSRHMDNFHALLVAALDISHELLLCKTEQEHQRQQVTQFISSLESKINKTVVGEEELLPQTD